MAIQEIYCSGDGGPNKNVGISLLNQVHWRSAYFFVGGKDFGNHFMIRMVMRRFRNNLLWDVTE